MTVDILPDSRTRSGKGGIRGPDGKTYIPVFCAQCGIPWGRVPEEHITFAFALCDPCAETMGPIAHLYVEPDAVFWQRVQEAQLEEFHRPLSVEELTLELADTGSVLSKLADEWQSKVKKTEK